MKLTTKFITSSIVVCSLIISLVSGGGFLVRRQEKLIENKVIQSKQIYNQVLKLQILLSEQVNSLKDFLLLQRQASDMAEYQKKMSNFSLILDDLDNKNSDIAELTLIRRRYHNITQLAKQISDQETSLEDIRQDLKTINSFEKDIKFYLESLGNTLAQKNELALNNLDKFRHNIIFFECIVIAIIVIIFIVQFRLIILPFLQSLKLLQTGTQIIGEGKLTYQLDIKTDDEIEQVAQSFNVMTQQLYSLYHSLENQVLERTQQLAKANEELQVEIEERIAIEETLKHTLEISQRSQKLLDQVINATPDWIFVKDRNFQYILVNDSIAQALGKKPSEIICKTDLELGFSEEEVFGNADKNIRGFRQDDQEVLNGKCIHNPYDPATDINGITHIFDTQKLPLIDEHGEIFGILGFAKDLTDRYQVEQEIKQKAEDLEKALTELKHTQTKMIQSEKMSSLGQMVAGVAHEINNPVNFIYGNISHAKDYIDDLLYIVKLYDKYYPHPEEEIEEEKENVDLDFLVEDLPKLLDSMKVGADRIQKIVLSLRTFSRLDEAEMKSVDIHQGIDSTLMILQNRLKAKPDHPEINVIRNYGALPLIDCYAGQLNQVFMNILANGIDALEESNNNLSFEEIEAKNNQIIIETQIMKIKEEDWIEIKISDNGSGMKEETRKQIFDPFFTTKKVGKGTGLGLSISHSIIEERHQGSLECQSQIDEGTTFIIKIPVHQKTTN